MSSGSEEEKKRRMQEVSIKIKGKNQKEAKRLARNRERDMGGETPAARSMAYLEGIFKTG